MKEKQSFCAKLPALIGRLLAGLLAAVILSVLPLDWERIGRTVTLIAVGMRQPENAAALLEMQLETVVEEEHPPPADTSDQMPPESTEAPPAQAPNDDALPAGSAAVNIPILSISPPANKGNGGKIITQSLPSGSDRLHGVAVNNKSGKAVDIAAALRAQLTQRWQDTDQPQVLIIHTHTTEQYMLYDAGYYNEGDRNRTTDQRQTVSAVGKAISAQLEAAGIGVVHDTSVHDSPYSGAYGRSAQTVSKYLQQYPSIRVVLDLHRDALMANSTDLTKPTVEIGGQKAAQVMIIAGVESTAELPHPNWQQNLALAAQWQQALNEAYPGLTRPLYTVASRYNQHLSPGYLLVEVGSEGNTVAEAVYSGLLLGKTLATLLS